LRVLLIDHPVEAPLEAEVFQTVQVGAGRFLPTGLLCVAAYLHRELPEVEVEVLACGLEEVGQDALGARVARSRPDVIGFSTFLHSLRDLRRSIASAAQACPEARIFLGGANALHYALEMAGYEGVDGVVVGDGEECFREIVERVAAGKGLEGVAGLVHREGEAILRNPPRPPERNLDRYPIIDRRLVPYRRCYSALAPSPRFTTVVTSRGCPYGCRFCITGEKRYRARSVESVMEELRECVALGIDSFMFHDELFNMNPERTLRLVEAMEVEHAGRISWSARVRPDNVDAAMARAMRRSGCYLLQLGIETGTDEGLKSIGKRTTTAQVRSTVEACREAGVETLGYFMVGLPHESERRQIRDSVRFARDLRCDYLMFSVFSPYPYSAFFDEGVERGLLSYEDWADHVRDPLRPFEVGVWPEHFSSEELYRMLARVYLRYYLRPAAVARVLGRLKSPRELWSLVRAFVDMVRR
jgi:anaerobic magnesium-protoporphyrin IX monomethyl ester cyclase